MEKPVAGEVVVIAFPFSDLSSSKRRPVLVLASLRGNDVILAQIASRMVNRAAGTQHSAVADSSLIYERMSDSLKGVSSQTESRKRALDKVVKSAAAPATRLP